MVTMANLIPVSATVHPSVTILPTGEQRALMITIVKITMTIVTTMAMMMTIVKMMATAYNLKSQILSAGKRFGKVFQSTVRYSSSFLSIKSYISLSISILSYQHLLWALAFSPTGISIHVCVKIAIFPFMIILIASPFLKSYFDLFPNLPFLSVLQHCLCFVTRI